MFDSKRGKGLSYFDKILKLSPELRFVFSYSRRLHMEYRKRSEGVKVEVKREEIEEIGKDIRRSLVAEGWNEERMNSAEKWLVNAWHQQVPRAIDEWVIGGLQTLEVSTLFAEQLLRTEVPDYTFGEWKLPYSSMYIPIRDNGAIWPFIDWHHAYEPEGVFVSRGETGSIRMVIVSSPVSRLRGVSIDGTLISLGSFDGMEPLVPLPEIMTRAEVALMKRPLGDLNDLNRPMTRKQAKSIMQLVHVICNLCLYVTGDDVVGVFEDASNLSQDTLVHRADRMQRAAGTKKFEKQQSLFEREATKTTITTINPFEKKLALLKDQENAERAKRGDSFNMRGHWVRGHFRKPWRGAKGSPERRQVRIWVHPFLRGDLENMVQRETYKVEGPGGE